MRKLTFALALLFAAAGLGSVVAADIASGRQDASDAYTINLRGLTWSNKSSAREVLSKLKGVAEMDIDCTAGVATIRMEKGSVLSKADVTAVLQGSRFQVASFKAPATAQVDDKKETVWKVTYSNGGGWSAAAKANWVRETLTKMKGVADVVVDSTAVAWIRTENDAKPSKEEIEKVLSPRRHKVTGLDKVVRPRAVVAYELAVSGFSWAGTCVEIREIFEKTGDHLAVMPFGDTGMVKILSAKADVLTKEAAEKALGANPKFKLTSFKEVKLQKKDPASRDA